MLKPGKTTKTVRLEQLEYGRLCVTPDGPSVERMGSSSQLGWSSHFPEGLVLLCAPSSIGVRAHEFEDLPKCPHGTVLRPVWLQGGVLPVIGRVGKRPEEGVGRESGFYTLARYLVALPGNQVEPWSMFKAMGPLRGITKTEAQELSSVITEPASESLELLLESQETRLQVKSFVREALIYVMSGIPVCVTEYIGEDHFYAWVTALWRLMPSGLRPYLSAGWGVGASMSGGLAVTYAERPANICATFSRASDGKWKWQPPEEWLDHKRHGREIFQPEHVNAGAHYMWYLSGCEPYDLPRIETFEENPKAEKLITSAPFDTSVSVAGPLDFQDQTIAILFTVPGLDARDKYLLGQWEQCLGRRANDSDKDPSDLSANFTFEKNKLLAFDLAYRALGDAERRQRAEAFLWGLLAPGNLESFAGVIDREPGAGSARARLFLALKGGNALDALEALYQCAESGEGRPLPDEAREALHQRLKPSPHDIDQGCIRLHASLLNLEEPPPDYLDWVKQHGFELALGLTEDNAGAGDFYNRIIRLTGSSSVRTLLSWAEKKEPTPEDAETIRNLSPVVRYRFFGQLMKLWNQFTKDKADQRERLLPWLRLARAEGQQINDPLLALAFGEEPQIVNLKHVTLAIEQRAVPPSLQRQVARLALKHYGILGTDIRRNVQNWANVLRYWPADVIAALWPGKEFDWHRDAAKKDGAECPEAWQAEPSMEELENLIKSGSLDNPAVARWYWRWAATAWKGSPGSNTPTVQICQYILNKEMPLPRNPDIEDVKRARKLAEADGESLPELKRRAELDWPAESNAVNLIVLLTFFPEANFTPTPQQLGALLDYRETVERHLKRDNAHPYSRYRFGIVTSPPMTVDYPGNSDGIWNDQYADYPFWAVFRGVPIKKQRPSALSEALSFYFYCDRDRSDEHIRDARAEVCQKYLQSYHGSELKKAIERVLKEFVIRWLYFHERRDLKDIRVILHGSDISGTSPFWNLVKLIRGLGHGAIISKAIDDFFRDRRREVADP